MRDSYRYAAWSSLASSAAGARSSDAATAREIIVSTNAACSPVFSGAPGAPAAASTDGERKTRAHERRL